MQFRDLQAQYIALKPEIDEAVKAVINSTQFILGPQVAELERQLAQHAGVKHCITCANGTDALMMVLMAWGIKPGDAVFVPDFTFIATAEVVSLLGATPVFVDVDAGTFNMNPQELERQIKRVKNGEISKDWKHLAPRAVIPVDLFGLPANYPEIEMIAKEHGLFVLEDAAQSFGGAINGKKAGSFGNAATTSFFPVKPLGCYGDGGAVFTNDRTLAEKIKSIRVHGKGADKYDNVRLGVNSRLDTLQAAVLLPKLKAFTDYELKDINKAAQLYAQKLTATVKTPKIPEGYYSGWAQYTVTFEDKLKRDTTQAALKEQGIPSMIYYPKPLHKQTAYKNAPQKKERFPITEKLCNCVLSLPIHPYITEEEIDKVAEIIKSS